MGATLSCRQSTKIQDEDKGTGESLTPSVLSPSMFNCTEQMLVTCRIYKRSHLTDRTRKGKKSFLNSARATLEFLVRKHFCFLAMFSSWSRLIFCCNCGMFSSAFLSGSPSIQWYTLVNWAELFFNGDWEPPFPFALSIQKCQWPTIEWIIISIVSHSHTNLNLQETINFN